MRIERIYNGRTGHRNEAAPEKVYPRNSPGPILKYSLRSQVEGCIGKEPEECSIAYGVVDAPRIYCRN